MVELVTSWGIPLAAVGLLGGLTLLFALFIGRWIDSQSASVLDEPRERRGPRKGQEK